MLQLAPTSMYNETGAQLIRTIAVLNAIFFVHFWKTATTQRIYEIIKCYPICIFNLIFLISLNFEIGRQILISIKE